MVIRFLPKEEPPVRFWYPAHMTEQSLGPAGEKSKHQMPIYDRTKTWHPSKSEVTLASAQADLVPTEVPGSISLSRELSEAELIKEYAPEIVGTLIGLIGSALVFDLLGYRGPVIVTIPFGAVGGTVGHKFRRLFANQV